MSKNSRHCKRKITVSVVVLLILLCIVSIVAYILKNSVVEANKTYLPQIAKQASIDMENSINNELKILETIAGNEKLQDEDLPIAEKIKVLINEIKKPNIISMKIIDLNGNGIGTDGRIFNASEQSNFQKAISGEPSISEPTISKVHNSLVVLYYVPIKNNGKVIDVLVSERSGTEISNHSGKVIFGKSGRAYVLDKNGTVIAHENKELVLNKNNTINDARFDDSQKPLADIEKRMINGENGYGKYEYCGKDKYIGYAPIKNTNWSIGIVIEKEELVQNVDTLRKEIIIGACLFVAIGVVVLLVILLNNEKRLNDKKIVHNEQWEAMNSEFLHNNEDLGFSEKDYEEKKE